MELCTKKPWDLEKAEKFCLKYVKETVGLVADMLMPNGQVIL